MPVRPRSQVLSPIEVVLDTALRPMYMQTKIKRPLFHYTADIFPILICFLNTEYYYNRFQGMKRMLNLFYLLFTILKVHNMTFLSALPVSGPMLSWS